jgi:hypothetical protein
VTKTPAPLCTVEIHNRSTTVTATDLNAALPLLEQQANDHFFDAWQNDQRVWWQGPLNVGQPLVGLTVAPSLGVLSTVTSVWNAQIFDDATDAAINGKVENVDDSDPGFHDLDPNTQVPYIIVLAKTAEDAGQKWTITFSHELLETLADPTGIQNRSVGGSVLAFEVCDPVEPQSYLLGTARVSNFVTPNWFDLGQGPPYDFLRTLTGAGQIAADGYSTTLVAGASWQTSRLSNGQLQSIPQSLTALAPTPPSRSPQLDRAARGLGRAQPQPLARVSTLESRVSLVESRLGIPGQAGAGAATACALAAPCGACGTASCGLSMPCGTCGYMPCGTCGYMPCGTCGYMPCGTCYACTACNSCGCCTCCGQVQGGSGDPYQVGLASLGYS